MVSKGRSEVKYEPLEIESEARQPNKKSCAPKIFYAVVIVFVFSSTIFVHVNQNYSEEPNPKANLKPNYSSKHLNLQNLPPSTHVPSLHTPQVLHTSTRPPPEDACGSRVQDEPVIKVGHLNTYMIGSYMEWRFGEKHIKMIAVVLRSEIQTYSCVMCCEGRNMTSQAEYHIHSDHFGFEYGTTTFTCPVQSECSIPTHVALTSSDDKESITSFQPVKNRDAVDVFPLNFTVCISVMYDYKNVLNLVQAMEMFKLLGVQRTAIYKTNCDSDTQRVLDYYVKQGFVELIPWTIKNHIQVSNGWRKSEFSGQLHYYGQIVALNDCVYRYMYQSRYVALQDLDELILPLEVKTWNELLPKIEEIYGNHFGFEFENNQFPFAAKPHTDYDIPKWKHVQGFNILNYIDRLPNDPHAFNNYKIIVNPRLVVETTVHGLLDSVNPGSPTIRVNNGIARMYHSKNFTYPPNTNIIQDTRLWDYKDDLIPAVSKVLQDCGFIEA